VVPPAVLQILEDGLNGAYARKPKPKTQEQKNTVKEKGRLRKRGK
jgi:hypothetical protein